MLSTVPRNRAARALLAGLLLLTASWGAAAQSLAPAQKSPARPAAKPAAKTATSTASNPPATAIDPAAAPLTPPPDRATAQATDAASSPHAPGDAPTENEIHQIVVSAATRDTQPPDTTATDTTVLTQEQLESGLYPDVAEALEKVPGVAVVQSGVPGQITSVFIHGADSNQTLFTIDGRQQPPGLSGATDFTNHTLVNVAQIEVVKTPAAGSQGSATGGVINLVSLNGRGLDKPVSSVSFEGGSFGTFREQAQSRGSVGNFDYAVSASDITADMDRQNENYRNTVYRGNFGYQATPTVYVDLHTGYSLANAGSPNSIETPDPVAHLLTEDWFLSPEVSAQVTDFYTTKVYYNHDQTRQTYHDDYTNFANFQFPSSTRLQLNTDSYDWQNNLQIARNWQITTGLQGGVVTADQFDDLAGMTTIHNTLSNTGGYAQSQWQPVTGLNVLSSVRYDAYSDYKGALSWRQGVTYQVPKLGTVVHASGSSSYTPPPPQDLYFPGFSNPNLKPETALSYETGIAQPLLGGKLTPSATYFHNNITNYILSLPPSFIPDNVGNVTTDGVELDLAAQPIEELKLDLNYTYLNATNDTENIRLVRRPRNSLNFTIDYTPIPQLTLDLGGSWVIGREDIDPTLFTQVDAPDYFTLRAAATYKLNRYVTLWVRGENLTNQYYEPVLGYPALGLGGYGGIKVSF